METSINPSVSMSIVARISQGLQHSRKASIRSELHLRECGMKEISNFDVLSTNCEVQWGVTNVVGNADHVRSSSE